MRLSRRIAVALVLSAGLSGSAPADDWKPAILDNDTQVDAHIAKLHSEMSELIKEAGGEARVTLFRTFQLVEIASVQLALGDSVKSTVKELNQQQKKALVDATTLVDRARDAVKDPTHHALLGVDRFNAIVADISWSKMPLVVSHSPSYIPPNPPGNRVPVVVGQRVHQTGADKPVLRIGDTTIAADDVEDGTLAFLVPRSAFEAKAAGTSFATAELTVYRVDGSWSNWRNWIPFHSAVQEGVAFPLLFTVLPEQLGTYTVTTVEPVTNTDTRDFKQPRELSAEKWGGAASKDSACFAPEQGYVFDLTTLKLIEDLHRGAKDNNFDAPGINSGGMMLADGGAAEKLICAAAFANTNCKECWGKTEGHIEVKMVRTTTEDGKPTTSASKALGWRDEPVPISSTASGQILNLEIFGELPRTVPLKSPKAFQFVEVKPDLDDKVTVISPVATRDAP